MSNVKQDYWFAVKRWGWGWGMPVRWQGWLVLFGYLGLIYAGIYYIAPSRSARVLAAYLIAITALLVVILVWKGQRPLRWRWGED